MAATHLADASALAQLHDDEVAALLGPLLVGGGIATCAVVDLELLGALGPGEPLAEVLAERRLFPRVAVDDAVLDRALEVEVLLGSPAPPATALIVAAAAERAGLVLLHHDRELDRIVEVTGQPAEWVGP